MFVEAAGVVVVLAVEVVVGRGGRDLEDRDPAVWPVDEHAAISTKALSVSVVARR